MRYGFRMDRRFVALGAILGLTGVAAGAFGAHGLKERLSPEMLAIFETGVRYQLVHAAALLFVGLAADRMRGTAAAGWLFLAGVAIFSGTLYVLATTGVRWLGAITPIGGVALLAGWAAIAWSAWRAAPASVHG